MNILIVEDNQELAFEVRDFLNRNRYICTIAKNCEEALGEVAASDYDVMLLDLGLPDGDGFEILKAIRKSKSRMAVIVITARGELDDRVDGLQLGADDYMTKPVDQKLLYQRNQMRNSISVLIGLHLSQH